MAGVYSYGTSSCPRASEYLKGSFVCDGGKEGSGPHCSLLSLFVRTKQGAKFEFTVEEQPNFVLGNLFAFVTSIVLIKLKWIHKHIFSAGLFFSKTLFQGQEGKTVLLLCM